jgi:hypothetical protein
LIGAGIFGTPSIYDPEWSGLMNLDKIHPSPRHGNQFRFRRPAAARPLATPHGPTGREATAGMNRDATLGRRRIDDRRGEFFAAAALDGAILA